MADTDQRDSPEREARFTLEGIDWGNVKVASITSRDDRESIMAVDERERSIGGAFARGVLSAFVQRSAPAQSLVALARIWSCRPPTWTRSR